VTELVIDSNADAIDVARRWVSSQLQPAGVGEVDLWAVELALTEALSNVIRHAYGGEASRQIRLESAFADGRLELRIVHWGEPFERASYTPPDLDAPSSGGYGVHLIELLMDEVERREVAGGGTQITLVKSRWEE
jgi:serine/threonine-protein kinase RsbW